MLRLRDMIIHEDERGYTLQETLVTIVILGILVVIGIIIFLNILERRRVEAATNQLVADMRLAHTNATNQLTDWRVVLYPERAGEDDGPDYYLVRLAAPYPAEPPASPVVTDQTPRYFPGNVKIVNIAGGLDSGAGSTGWAVAPSVLNRTRTLEFNADGAMKFYQSVSGSTCVTVDGDPENKITVLAATSRAKVNSGSC